MISIETVYNKLSGLISKPGKRGFAVGLDIGTSCVKLVKTEVQNDKHTVSVLGIEKIKDSNNIGEAVKALLDKTSVQEKNINLGISGKQTMIRCITLPDMKEADFKNSMKYEAVKHIPFPIDDVILDHVILKHNIDNNEMLVLIAAAKKDFVETRIKMVSELGLTVDVVDIDSLAVINIFNLSLAGEHQDVAMSAILNLGAQFSGLVILKGGLVRFSRDIAFGGNMISRRISAKFGISVEEADKIKLAPSYSAEVQQLIELALNDLSGELRLSFDYYESQTGEAVKQVYLIGGGSCLKGIAGVMNNTMNIDFKIWNPFSNLGLNKQLDKNLIENSAQQFAVAAGLSLR